LGDRATSASGAGNGSGHALEAWAGPARTLRSALGRCCRARPGSTGRTDFGLRWRPLGPRVGERSLASGACGEPRTRGVARCVGGGRRLVVAVALVAAAIVVPGAFAGGKAPLSPLASVSVVGSGPISWGTVAVRKAPARSAPVVTTLGQFRADFHPRTVLALGARLGPGGEPSWYRISIPGRPNGRTGWIPAAAANVTPVDRWLVVYRGSRKFELYVDGRLRRTGPIAVGAPGMETPVGLFYVQSRFVPSRYPILGAYAFETSGYSKLSDWPGGGVVGVHGTNTPWLIGQAVSHGCVRLRNSDILALRRLVRVGTPVKIVAA
jgi:lipoprotein-anchoring transpeptidase ErfK/SrfK